MPFCLNGPIFMRGPRAWPISPFFSTLHINISPFYTLNFKGMYFYYFLLMRDWRYKRVSLKNGLIYLLYILIKEYTYILYEYQSISVLKTSFWDSKKDYFDLIPPYNSTPLPKRKKNQWKPRYKLKVVFIQI